ncbi:MAG: hypothetical protein PHS67_03070 [Sphaerochaetaceae bacterium]|nr:hypothetical protein [Sphaerochaetaceae bacterium]
MARITKKVFNDLALWMMGFGLLVGVIFPFFMSLLGVSNTITHALWFRFACIFAGLFGRARKYYISEKSCREAA